MLVVGGAIGEYGCGSLGEGNGGRGRGGIGGGWSESGVKVDRRGKVGARPEYG